jgi:hypothetical protein
MNRRSRGSLCVRKLKLIPVRKHWPVNSRARSNAILWGESCGRYCFAQKGVCRYSLDPLSVRSFLMNDCNSIGILGAFNVSNLIAGKIQTHQATAPLVCACRKHRRGDFYI